MFRAHVLIIRRSKLHYTASGIITPIGVIIPGGAVPTDTFQMVIGNIWKQEKISETVNKYA